MHQQFATQVHALFYISHHVKIGSHCFIKCMYSNAWFCCQFCLWHSLRFSFFALPYRLLVPYGHRWTWFKLSSASSKRTAKRYGSTSKTIHLATTRGCCWRLWAKTEKVITSYGVFSAGFINLMLYGSSSASFIFSGTCLWCIKCK